MTERTNEAAVVWHDEAERLEVWGTLDPPDACMCRECVLGPAHPNPEPPTGDGGREGVGRRG